MARGKGKTFDVRDYWQRYVLGCRESMAERPHYHRALITTSGTACVATIGRPRVFLRLLNEMVLTRGASKWHPSRKPELRRLVQATRPIRNDRPKVWWSSRFDGDWASETAY